MRRKSLVTVEVGINGSGRIERLVFRRIQDVEEIEAVAISDLTDVKMSAHLLKYDTTQSRFNGIVEVHEGPSDANSKEIRVLANRNPEELPRGELGVDIVLEYTGFFTSKETAERHLTVGIKRVIISVPDGDDVPTIIYNTNHETSTGEETAISGVSCTTNCLTPMVKALYNNFGVVEGLMTIIHTCTGDQTILDGPHPKGGFRRVRVAVTNIILNSTGATKITGLVIPKLNSKLDDVAQRVPVTTGSLIELVTVLDKEVTVDEVNAVMEKAANKSYGYNTDEIASSDIVDVAYGPLFDATQTKVMTAGDKQLVKTVAWYDSKMPYTIQLIRTLECFTNL